jgi:hypothetical protein
MRFFVKDGDTRLQMVLRAAFVSAIFVACIVYLWRASPLIRAIYASDELYLSHGITALFVCMFVIAFRNIMQISRELSLIRDHLRFKMHGRYHEAITEVRKHRGTLVYDVCNALERATKDDHRANILDIVRDISEEKIIRMRLHGATLVKLGFLGTLIGMMFAFSENFASLAGANADIQSILGNIVTALKVAIGTSIVGVVGNIWLSYLQNILENGVRHLAINLVKLEIIHDSAQANTHTGA